MAVVTLKSLHTYLRLLENTAELKRKMPSSSNPRTFKEGLSEVGRLAGVDEAVFKEPRSIAALIGAQRFIMIRGEPSASDQVARIFDGSRVLFEVEAPDKAKLDAYLAATDLLEAMALTPWRMSLHKAVSQDPSNSVRSMVVIARLFQRFGRGEATREQANREIADHLLAFGRQFSADAWGVQPTG